MATKEPDRPNPNPSLMTPSHTKLMEQCRVEAEYQFEEQTGFIAHSGSVTPQFWIGGYAQALFDERSKRPTVEQVMEVVEEWRRRDVRSCITAAQSREALESEDSRAGWILLSDLRSRLTKLLGDGE